MVVPTASIEGRWFPRCLSSIRQAAPEGIHVIAVESSGSEFNFSHSVNVGMGQAPGDVIVLNDDVFLARDALTILTASRRRCGEGIYQPYIFGLDGAPHDIGWSIQRGLIPFAKKAVGSFVRSPRGQARRAALRAVLMTNVYPIAYHQSPVEGFDGFSFSVALISAGARSTIGPVDEGFQLGYDDVDYSLRCHARGVSYFGVSRAVAYHALNGTRHAGDPRELSSEQHLRSKWPRPILLKTLNEGPRGRIIP